MIRSAVAMTLLAVATVAAAEPVAPMSVATLVAKANALQAKGMGAMFSPDLKLVINEMRDVGKTYRADAAAANRRGDHSLGCPPPEGQRMTNSTEIMRAFSAVSAADAAKTSARAAFYRAMSAKYPCQSK